MVSLLHVVPGFLPMDGLSNRIVKTAYIAVGDSRVIVPRDQRRTAKLLIA